MCSKIIKFCRCFNSITFEIQKKEICWRPPIDYIQISGYYGSSPENFPICSLWVNTGKILKYKTTIDMLEVTDPPTHPPTTHSLILNFFSLPPRKYSVVSEEALTDLLDKWTSAEKSTFSRKIHSGSSGCQEDGSTITQYHRSYKRVWMGTWKRKEINRLQ